MIHPQRMQIESKEHMSKLGSNTLSTERRRETRKRLVHRGKVVYGEGAFTVDCVIRNISATGARIMLDKGVGIPSCVYLIDIPSGMAHAAEVASILPPSFGLKFLRTYQVAELKDQSLKYLKHCWSGCAR
jgi:hypothetical protein